MKKRFLNSIRSSIKKQYPNYSSDKLDEIMYGIEGLYLTVTKSIIIFSIAAILGILKELLLLLICFNVIRMFAFGMHADKSSTCLLFSTIIFILGTFICKYIIIPREILYVIYTIELLIIIIYSPADTIKRPLIKKKKRKKFKIISILVTICFFIISICINNNLLINCLTFGLAIECLLILPMTYKIFNMPYKNYLNYSINT